MKKREEGRAASTEEVPTKVVEDETVVLPTEEQIAAAQGPAPANVVSPSAEKAVSNVVAPESTEEMKDVYDELFGLK